jgi:hypothetical protein
MRLGSYNINDFSFDNFSPTLCYRLFTVGAKSNRHYLIYFDTREVRTTVRISDYLLRSHRVRNHRFSVPRSHQSHPAQGTHDEEGEKKLEEWCANDGRGGNDEED